MLMLLTPLGKGTVSPYSRELGKYQNGYILKINLF